MDWVSGCVFSRVPPLGRALINSPVDELDYHPVVFQASVFSHSSPIRLLTSVSIGCFSSPCLFSCCSPCFPCAHCISSDLSYSPFAVCLLLTWTLASLEIRFAGCAFGSHHSPACPPAATIPDRCTSQVGPPAHLQPFSTLT